MSSGGLCFHRVSRRDFIEAALIQHRSILIDSPVTPVVFQF